MGVARFFHDVLGLPVLELATICVNLTLVLLFLFVVSVRRALVYQGGFRFGKNGNSGNASPICSVIDEERRGVRIGLVFKLSVVSCFYVLFVHVLALGFEGGALIWGEDDVDLSLLSVPAAQCLAWFVLSFWTLDC